MSSDSDGEFIMRLCSFHFTAAQHVEGKSNALKPGAILNQGLLIVSLHT